MTCCTSGALAPTYRALQYCRACRQPTAGSAFPSNVQSRIYKLEAAGILIIGAVVLILTLTRYWHHIAWGAR